VSDLHEVEGRRGVEGFASDLAAWASWAGERAPAYVRLARLVLNGNLLDNRFVAAWSGRAFAASFDRPLLLFASLRHAALVEGARHPLHAALVAATTSDIHRDALADAFTRRDVWRTLAQRHVQTNETSRAIAWRWPAALAGCANAQRPLALFDLGASAGLNLVADALDDPWVDGAGDPIACATAPSVILRRGFDARPIDVRDDDAALWLRACVFAGEREREERLERAITAMRDARARGPIEIETIDIADAGARLLDICTSLPPGAFALAYQSHVRDYLPPATQSAHANAMDRWLRAMPIGGAAWITLEPSFSGGRLQEAAITARVRVGIRVHEIALATCPHHPRAVAIVPGAPEELARLLTT
jgi:hypothetical protein